MTSDEEDVLIGDIEKGIINLEQPANAVLLAVAKLLIKSRAEPHDAIELCVQDKLGLVYKVLLSVEEYPELREIMRDTTD